MCFRGMGKPNGDAVRAYLHAWSLQVWLMQGSTGMSCWRSREAVVISGGAAGSVCQPIRNVALPKSPVYGANARKLRNNRPRRNFSGAGCGEEGAWGGWVEMLLMFGGWAGLREGEE